MAFTYRSNVQQILRAQERTVTWFCRRVGISRALFYRMERGERTMTADYRERAADVLHVPQTLLFLPSDMPQGTAFLPSGTAARVPA